MTLLGFESFGERQELILRNPEWGGAMNLAGYSNGPYGGKAQLCFVMKRTLAAPVTKLFVSQQIATYGAGTSQDAVTFYGDSGATAHITVVINATTGVVSVCRGTAGGTVLATYTEPRFQTNVNYLWLETSCTVHDSTGNVKVRINEVERINFTGDTKNGGTATTIDAFQLGAGAYMYRSDCVWNDDAGSGDYSGFPGEKRIIAITPSAAGNSTGWTPDSGSNYARVNEDPYSASNYVSADAASSGTRDLYTMTDLPATVSAVDSVKVFAIAKKTDAGAASIKNALRTASTNYASSGKALSASDLCYGEQYDLNPNTGVAWTVANVNALEAGVEVA